MLSIYTLVFVWVGGFPDHLLPVGTCGSCFFGSFSSVVGSCLFTCSVYSSDCGWVLSILEYLKSENHQQLAYYYNMCPISIS